MSVGRPEFEITPEVLDQAEKLAMRQLSKKHIALMLGMSVGTFCNKQNEYIEFFEAIERGYAKGIAVIGNAAYDRAKSGSEKLQMFFLKTKGDFQETINHKHEIVEDRLKELE